MTKRRGRGEGGLEHLPDGRWRGTLSLGNKNGKRRRLRIFGTNKQDVLNKMREAQAARVRGRLPDDSSLTVGQWLDQWLLAVKPSVARSTAAEYARHVGRHIKPVVGDVRLVKLGPEDIERMYAEFDRGGMSAALAAKIGTTLTMAIRVAVSRGRIAADVSAGVAKPRRQRPAINPLNAEEAGRFVAACRGHRHEALLLLALDSGMRSGELLGLCWDCVDLKAGAVTVQRSFDGHGLKDVKTKHSRRRIRITPSTLAALAKLAEFREDDRGLVFRNERGGFLNKNNVRNRSLGQVLRKAGLRSIRFHDLRHTCATLLLLSGVNVKAVSQRLGHSSVVITLDIYAHVLPAMEDEATAKMEALLTSQSGKS